MNMDLYEKLMPFLGRGKAYGTVTQVVDLDDEEYERGVDLINLHTDINSKDRFHFGSAAR